MCRNGQTVGHLNSRVCIRATIPATLRPVFNRVRTREIEDPHGREPVPATTASIKLATVAARAASEKLAEEIAVIDVSGQLIITDCFVIASAATDRQVGAIVDEVEEKLREVGAKPIRREGVREGRWALLDYGEIVVHVQRTEEREFYGLDRLWRDCPFIEVEGIETPERPETWSNDVDVRAVDSIDQIPLASEEPDANEL
ncbi:ribosome silencing factor [Corynebacterium sp. TAE3-ERU16]|nr:ribosome silencing factor [Corynebacterium sp. TAE3-ERU16]